MEEKVINMFGTKVFKGSDEERVGAFLQEVKKLCERYDCAILPEITHIGTETKANVVAIAKPRLPVPNLN